MKKWVALVSCMVFWLAAAGCQTEEADTARLSGSCAEILQQIYDTAEFDDSFRESLEGFESGELDKENSEFIIGTTDVKYSDSVYSIPAISSVPYQCVVLRVSAGQDIGAAKEILSQNADPAKWICVQAESVAVENIGDVVLVVMGGADTVQAVKDAFLALEG